MPEPEPTVLDRHDPGDRGQMIHPRVGDKATGETALYRLRDAGERLLYVGISRNPMLRWGAHVEQHSWWRDVDSYELTWYATKELAAEAEKRAIRAEDPLHNVQHTPKQGMRIAAAAARERLRAASATSDPDLPAG